MQGHTHLKMSTAWVGGSILNRPPNAALQARGFYYTSSGGPPYKPVPPRGAPFQVPKQESTDKQSRDNQVVLEALQRLLRKQKDVAQPFQQFGQSRPIR